jgi:hypothetical protein
MRSNKKSAKVLSALAMASAAGIFARTAHAVTLSMYYGSDTNYSNSNNGIFIGNGYDPSPANSNAHDQAQFLTGAVAAITPNIGAPTTINIFAGQYLSISIDAVLTGNPNEAAGTKQAGDLYTQPSFLGLAWLGINVGSSDLTGTKLTPYSTDTQAETTIAGLPSYLSTGILNVDSTPAPQAGLGTNDGGGYNALPKWTSFQSPGLVQPNLPGYDTAPNSSGRVGFGTAPTSGVFPYGTNTNTNARVSTANVIEAFGSASNTASYAAATDFLDSLTFKALNPGVVTLTPGVVAGSTAFWQYNGNVSVSGRTTSSYADTFFSAADKIKAAPVLVVNIIGESHPIAGYSGSANPQYAPTIGTLVTSTGNGSYTVAQITGLNGGLGDTVGTAEAKTFNPSTAEEIFAYDVLVNGTQANASQLAVLASEINFFDGGTAGVVATTQSRAPDPFASQYNLFLDASGFSDAFMGLDLSSSNDSALVGYTFSAVAVVPEPATLGLLAIGAVALSARRHRPKP